MEKEMVSVIITTYNRKNLVCKAIESVLSQTYQGLECIIVDDRSTDGTIDKLTKLYSHDPRVHIVCHIKNSHLSAARNTGIYASSGKYIAFLDDDDVWLSTKLEKQINCFEASSRNIGLIYCWFDVYRDTEVINTRRPCLKGYIFDKVMLSQPLGNGSTLLIRREVIDKIGGFDEALKRGIDGDFIRRLTQYYEVGVVAEVLVHYFVDHDGHARITGTSRESRVKGVHSHEVKLIKFGKELGERPVLHSRLLVVIALEYAILGDIKNALSYQLQAFRVSATSLSTYVSLPRMIYYLIFHRV